MLYVRYCPGKSYIREKRTFELQIVIKALFKEEEEEEEEEEELKRKPFCTAMLNVICHRYLQFYRIRFYLFRTFMHTKNNQ